MAKNDHMAFEVSNMDAAIAFYTQSLGLRLVVRDVSDDEDCAFLELDGGNLELLQRRDGAPFEKQEIRPPYCPHIALSTPDMTETLRMIEERNIPVVKGPIEVPGAVKLVYVRDPDNNVIEYVQWLIDMSDA